MSLATRISDLATRVGTEFNNLSITYAKIDGTLTGRATDNDGVWDFSANAIIEAAFSAGTTAISFTNLEQNKVVTVELTITNSAAFTLPGYCVPLAGSVAASGVDGTYFMDFRCLNSASGSEKVTVLTYQ